MIEFTELDRLEQIELIDMFKTMEQLASDCVFILEDESYLENKKEDDMLLELKVARITDEIEKFDEITLGGYIND